MVYPPEAMVPGEIVVSGDVSLHSDERQHMAVILEVSGDECEALFFTSNPNWASNSRRATRDEIALAGFVSSRPTYLAYVMRPTWDFSPTGVRFPAHRIESLKQEFRAVQKVLQVVGGQG